MAKDSEIRNPWKSIALGNVAGVAAKALSKSLRYETSYQCEGPDTAGPRIFALYHNRILGAVGAAAPWFALRPGVVLTSASKDGALLETVVKRFGLEAVRGSSSRRGVAALVALRRELEAGKHICVTPDGPRGPCYVVQPGLVKLASLTQIPIIPFWINYHKHSELKTWDRFQIPMPFSRAQVVFGSEIVIPADLGREEFEMERKKVEEVMQGGLNLSER